MPTAVKVAAAKASHQLIVEAIAGLKESLEQFQGNDNPQVVVACQRRASQIEVLEAVRESLEGSPLNLRILAGRC